MNQYKYTFCFTEKELREFCIRAVADLYYRRPAMWIILFVLCAVEMFFTPAASAALLLLFLAAIGIDVVRTYRFFKKEHLLERRIMWLEDGLLKCSTSGYSEIPCGRITVIRKSAHLLMLGYPQSKRRLAWYPMPLRVFCDEEELGAFLERIRRPVCPNASLNPNAADGVKNQEAPGTGRQGRFHFTFFMEQEKWIWIYKEAVTLINGRTLGFPRGQMLVFGIYGTVYVTAILFWYFLASVHNVLFPLILLLLLLYVELVRWKSNPEKNIRRRLKSGDVQNDIYGTWEIEVTEDGIVDTLAGRNKSFLPWKEFGWVVETEYLFFLFKKNRTQFIPIPKENMESRAQAEALCGFCCQKGLIYLPGKRAKYWPNWVFGLVFCILLLLLFFTGVLLGIQRNTRKIMESIETPSYETNQEWEEEFRPEDYPDYVPLDAQVKVLSSLGFLVPRETVESVRETMKQNGMKVYVEGCPYTWLLTELGSSSYDEDWNVNGYSAQAFWFDFEGWDVSTDYIGVLEGMLALAKEGPLSSVEAIREDTGKVNWEEGSGSVTVFLKWEGRTYSWKMDMNYDWIDGNILGVLNSLLETTQAKERFYVTGDNGQGAVVFYRTPEWAGEFQKATGISLENPVTGGEG